MKISHGMVALGVLVPALAWSAPVHNIWTTAATFLTAPGVGTTPVTTSGSLSWTEASGYATANVRVKSSTGDLYEFQLASVSGLTSAYEINGSWNVSRNGVALCTNCAGHAYGLNGSGYFKIYVDNDRYGVAANFSSRYDF